MFFFLPTGLDGRGQPDGCGFYFCSFWPGEVASCRLSMRYVADMGFTGDRSLVSGEKSNFQFIVSHHFNYSGDWDSRR